MQATVLCKIAMIPWHHFIILYQITYIFFFKPVLKVPSAHGVHGTIQHVFQCTRIIQSIVIVEICILYGQWVLKCNMYMYIYILYHTYIHTYRQTDRHTYVRTYIRTYVRMHVCVYNCIYIYMHACVCV